MAGGTARGGFSSHLQTSPEPGAITHKIAVNVVDNVLADQF